MSTAEAATAPVRSGPRLRDTLALVTVCTVILALPALVAGRPFLFYDSDHYYLVGKRIFDELGTVLGFGAGEANVAPTVAANVGEAPSDGHLSSILAGRSPTYGAFLVALSATLSMWTVVFVQAALVVTVITRFLDIAFGERVAWAVLAAVAVCSFLSSAGFHAGFMMPDVFAGIGVLALLCMLVGRLDATGLAVCAAIVAAAGTTHATTLFLLASLLLFAVALSFAPLRWKANVRVVGIAAFALVAALALNSAYTVVVERITGNELRAAPYLTARVIADGPGARFLREHCDGSGLSTCAYAIDDYVDHNDFLWGWAGAKHTFIAAPAETQRAIQDEQNRFVLQVFATYPVQQAAASLRNAFRQLFAAGISEIDFGALRMITEPAFRDSAVIAATPDLSRCLAASSACPNDPPVAPVWQNLVRVDNIAFTLALAALLVVWLRQRASGGSLARELASADPLLVATCLAMVALLVNAVICGVMSGPHDRYQARLAWIVPAMLMAAAPTARRLVRHARNA